MQLLKIQQERRKATKANDHQQMNKDLGMSSWECLMCGMENEFKLYLLDDKQDVNQNYKRCFHCTGLNDHLDEVIKNIRSQQAVKEQLADMMGANQIPQ